MPYPDTHRYDDLLRLPHPVSRTHRPMNVPDRAAQFSPFAALVGLEDTLSETARLEMQKQLKVYFDMDIHIA